MRTKYNKNQLKDIIDNCINWAEVCRFLNLPISGSSGSHLKSIADFYNIDYLHFTGKPRNYKHNERKKLTVEEYVTTKNPHSHTLRLKLINEKIKENKCEICNIINFS